METLTGVHITETLYENERIRLCRGRNIRNTLILVKTIKEYPADVVSTFLGREKALTDEIPHDGIIKALEIIPHRRSPALVLEDFPGQTLALAGLSARLDIPHYLGISIRLAEILAAIHEKKIIHNNLSPWAIFVGGNMMSPHIEKISVSMTCFERSFGVRDMIMEELPAPSFASLAYLPPEATAKMGRAADARSDLYSLGCVMYELAAGAPPFTADDASSLAYAHVSERPRDPRLMNDGLPPVISKIIMKLLEKDPEVRYQSAIGLYSDLKKCLIMDRKKITARTFSLGKNDVRGQILLPERLYDRDREFTILSAVLKEACRGDNLMVTVSGQSGTGKTALVRDFFGKNLKNKGMFVSGKFDQYRRETPLGAFKEIFSGLIHSILTGSDREVAEWKDKIINALHPNTGLIIDLVPELESIIGPSEAVQGTDPLSAMSRLYLYLEKFIRIFAQKDRPLFIFLDDLHWADLASLELLKIIATNEELRNVCVICAYRDNDIGQGLTSALQAIATEKKITELNLKNLRKEAVTTLVAAAFGSTISRAVPLADLVHAKTMGNPFFVREFLREIYKNNLVFRDQRGRWQGNFEGIRALPASDNVIELLSAKIKELPANQRAYLMTAACIGSSFSRVLLSGALCAQDRATGASLKGLVATGMLVQENGEYHFIHDRIQEAAYQAMTPAIRINTHYLIGKILYEQMINDGIMENLFNTVDQLNRAVELMDERERVELADLNCLAGKKAKRHASIDMSLKYLRFAYDLLSDSSENPEGKKITTDVWEKYYHLSYTVHLELAEAEYLNGSIDRMEDIILEGVANARDEIEKAELKNIAIVQSCMAGRYLESITIGAEVLSSLGIHFDFDDPAQSISEEYADVKKRLEERGVSFLINLPRLRDVRFLTAIKILRNMSSSAPQLDVRVFNLIGLLMVRISFMHGNSPESLDGYLMLAMMMIVIDGNYALAHEIGKSVMTLAEKFGNKLIICETHLKYANFIAVWKEPLEKIQNLNRTGFKAGLESGELKYEGDIYGHLIENQYHQGIKLNQVQAEILKAMPFMRKIKNQLAEDHLEGMMQIIQYLLGSTAINLDSFLLSCNSHLDICKTRNNIIVFCLMNGYIAQALYMFGEHRKASEYINKGIAILRTNLTIYFIAEMVFFHSLILAALHMDSSEEDKKNLMLSLDENRRKLKLWSDTCPENFLHKFLLVEAESARITGNELEAIKFYDLAIEEAQKNRFTQNEAIANELAGKYWLARGKKDFASLYLMRARDLYRKWSALRKVRNCNEIYSGVLYETGPAGVDIMPFVAMAQEIISDVKLDQILAKILTGAVKSTSAQKGVLLIEKDKELFVEAEIQPPMRKVKVLHSSRPRNSKLPLSIIQYVARTGEVVNLSDATQDPLFGNDPYILKNRTKSIFCHKKTGHMGKTVVVLYLENKIISGAFAELRGEILNFMSSHYAIAIGNARLYREKEETLARLEEAVRARDRLLVQYEDSHNKNLQARMRPHFIYNALHTIHALLQLDPSKADVALLSFSEICRYYTDRSFESLVPFQEEWDFTRNYLDFEQLRLRDKFSFTMKAIGKFGDFSVPPLLLQPLVENSIKHGFNKSKKAGKIEVIAAKKKNCVFIEVTDNGVGLQTKDPFSRTLRNIADRLRFHYLDSDLRIQKNKRTGTRVSMRIACDKTSRL